MLKDNDRMCHTVGYMLITKMEGRKKGSETLKIQLLIMQTVSQ